MRSNKEKLKIYQSLFTSDRPAYGTYDVDSGKVFVVRKKPTQKIILNHLLGKKPYGVFLLEGDRTRAVVADFDSHDRNQVLDFYHRAKHYNISCYIETSKSKGHHHIWIWFNDRVPADKARLVVQEILDEIDCHDTEIFPKQSALSDRTPMGNFLNAPLFARLVPEGKTVFVDPSDFKPYDDQWDFLESIIRNDEATLDAIIEMNDLSFSKENTPTQQKNDDDRSYYGLPLCAQKMLANGVTQNQRVSCFRLAVHFKIMKVPLDTTIYTLKHWAQKNRPRDGKRVISEEEIQNQVTDAYKGYRSYGCDDVAVKPFCDPSCPLHRMKNRKSPQKTGNEPGMKRATNRRHSREDTARDRERNV